MKTIKIKSRWNDVVIFEAQCDNVKSALLLAIKQDADLRCANLRGADLQDVDLQDVDLLNADLRGADLRDANLQNTNLQDTDLQGADLRDAKGLNKLTLSQQSIVPERGTFTTWKKINNYLIELEVPKRAKRLNSVNSRKCRVSIAKVISITNIETKEEIKSITGGYDENFKYQVNRLAIPDKFNDDIFRECANGIHCFITREEAIDY